MNIHQNKFTLRRDIPAICTIFAITLLIIFSCLSPDTVYGSKADWSSQHYAVPEYFRTLFYATGELFPSYAPNTGGGENIFSLSYYGLFSPLMLPSYLFPSIPMGKYIIFTSVLAALLSEFELYLLLRRRYTLKISFLTVLFFAFSTPLILNTHRHIMFTSYMPFLLLTIQGAELFFKTGKRSLLAIGTFLTVMCNYFFAMSAVMSLIVYGIWLTLEKKGRPDFRKLLPYTLYIGIGVLSASVLLLPTLHEILCGRDVSECTFSLSSLVPEIRFDKLTYYNSAMGLSGFGIFSALYFLVKGNRHQRFTAVLIFSFALFPLTLYVLNGTLYADPKVLFPFLPLALTLTADMLKELDHFKGVRLVIVFVMISAVSFFVNDMSLFTGAFLADAFIAAIAVYAYSKTHKKFLICAFFIIPFTACVLGNHYDELTNIKAYDTANSKTVSELVSQLPENELYRTAIDTSRLYTVNKVYSPSHYQDTLYSSLHSQYYNRFYFNEMFNENEYRNSALTTRTRNVFFNSFMGNRYYITNQPVSYCGLEKIKETPDGYFLYENKNAFPMAYFSDKTMSERQYSSLGYPDKIDALMRYTIVPDDIPDKDFRSEFKPVDIGDIFRNYDENGEKVIRTVGGSAEFSYELPENVRGKLLLIRFHVSDPKNIGKFNWETNDDIRIKINGVKNTLSSPEWKYCNHNNWFEYVISDMKDTLDISVTGKEVHISEISAFSLDPNVLGNMAADRTAFKPDMRVSRGDMICGDINAQSDGYFCTSLVFHKGFTLLIDGEKTEPVKINKAFLGFPVKQGEHNVEIRFKAPMLATGKALSALGVSLLILCMIIDIIYDRKLIYAVLRHIFRPTSAKKRRTVRS